MKDTKHTSGTWYQRTQGSEIEIKNGLYTIAMVHNYNEPHETNEANAALISAAPDLLEALTCHEFQMCIMDWKTLPSNSNGKIAFDKIQAAIAKATNTK